MAQKWRKKPVVIEAERVTVLLELARHNWQALPEWIRVAYEKGDVVFGAEKIIVKTIEGAKVEAATDSWILRGVKGELYPCRDDIFRETYELVEG